MASSHQKTTFARARTRGSTARHHRSRRSAAGVIVALALSVVALGACEDASSPDVASGSTGVAASIAAPSATRTPAPTASPQAAVTPAPASAATGGAATGVSGVCAPGADGSVADGWARTVMPDYVLLEGNGMRVELHYALAYDDVAGNGIITDRLWDRLLGGRYRAVQTFYGGEAFGLPYYTVGTATDLQTGDAAYVEVAESPENGLMRPAIVIARDEAAFTSAFKDSSAVVAMHRYNYLPLSCGSLAGTWTTSSSEAAEAYDATGSYTGIFVAASSLDLAISEDGRYALHEQAYVNGTASDSDESGVVEVTGQGLALTSDEGKRTDFTAAFVAVRGGLALFLQNRQYTGEQYVLYPSR